jgi:energy-coupling factor transporter ATP-binding protein EcfA2
VTIAAAEQTTPQMPLAPATPRGEPAIVCKDVWKQYYFYAHRPRKLKEAFIQFVTRRTPPAKDAPVWALQDFNLTVGRGETVGVVGHNGAGKSTLLKLLSRILVPTKGTVQINGRLSAIIELGAGFHPDLTARENVFLAASFLGFSRKKTMGLYDRIVDFAELQERRSRRPADRRDPRGRRRDVSAEVHRRNQALPARRQGHPLRQPRDGPSETTLPTRHLAQARPDHGRGRRGGDRDAVPRVLLAGLAEEKVARRAHARRSRRCLRRWRSSQSKALYYEAHRNRRDRRSEHSPVLARPPAS